MQIKWDLTGLPLATREFLKKQRDEATVKALLAANERQRQLAIHNRNNPTRARNGFGGQTMVFDPVVMAGLRRQAAAGDHDSEIQKHYARKYPELYRTKHLPTKLQVGYGSTPELVTARDVQPSRPGVKFARVYSTSPAARPSTLSPLTS